MGANVVSPATNLSLSGLFLKIEWDALYSNRDIYGYEIKLIPYRGDEPAVNFAETKIIPAQRTESTHSTHMEVCEGVYYKMEMRAIGQGFIPGEWSSPALLLAGSNGETPAIPSISIIEEVGPTVLHITTSTPNPPNTPHFIQIFKNEKVIYEGAPGIYSHMLLPEDESVTIKARVVAGGGVCSEFATCADVFSASSFDAILAAPMGMLAIPINFYSAADTTAIYTEGNCTARAGLDDVGYGFEISEFPWYLANLEEDESACIIVTGSGDETKVPNGAYSIDHYHAQAGMWWIKTVGYQEQSPPVGTTADVDINISTIELSERASLFSIPDNIKITRMSFTSRGSRATGAIDNLKIKAQNAGGEEVDCSLTLSNVHLFTGPEGEMYDEPEKYYMHQYNRGNIGEDAVLSGLGECRVTADRYSEVLLVRGTLFLYYEKVGD